MSMMICSMILMISIRKALLLLPERIVQMKTVGVVRKIFLIIVRRMKVKGMMKIRRKRNKKEKRQRGN